MRKLIFLVLVLSSCYKAVFNPIENYKTLDNKRYLFDQSYYGLKLWRNSSKGWENCVKSGNNSQGIINISGIEYIYYTDKDTVKLLQNIKDTEPPVLKYVLVLDRTQRNVFGIFQK